MATTRDINKLRIGDWPCAKVYFTFSLALHVFWASHAVAQCVYRTESSMLGLINVICTVCWTLYFYITRFLTFVLLHTYWHEITDQTGNLALANQEPRAQFLFIVIQLLILYMITYRASLNYCGCSFSAHICVLVPDS